MSEAWKISSSPLRKGDVVRIDGVVSEVVRARQAGAVIRSLPPGRAVETVISLCSEVERLVA